jgi:hypothetical protein
MVKTSIRSVSGLVAVIAIAVMFVACSDTDRSTPTTAASTASPESTIIRTGPSTSVHTKNEDVACIVNTEFARCDVTRPKWSPPPKPADCDGDWGTGAVSVNDKGSVEHGCVTDSARGTDSLVLAEGRGIEVGQFVCDATASGMKCTDTKSGHGFEVSRARYRFF